MRELKQSAVYSLLTPIIQRCSTVGMLNMLAPYDTGARQVMRDLAYGPHPRQRIDIYAPLKKLNNESSPLLFFIYGCSRVTPRKANYAFVGHAFAAHGFVTGICDYRVAQEAGYPDALVDCGKALKAFRAAAKGYTVGARPVYLVGHSAGAYHALMLALADDIARMAGFSRHLVAAVACLSGLYRWEPAKIATADAGCLEATEPEATQLISVARSDAPPTLLLHGKAEPMANLADAQALAAAMAHAGAHAQLTCYDHLGQAGTLAALSRPFRQRADVLDDIIRFLTQGALQRTDRSPDGKELRRRRPVLRLT